MTNFRPPNAPKTLEGVPAWAQALTVELFRLQQQLAQLTSEAATPEEEEGDLVTEEELAAAIAEANAHADSGLAEHVSAADPHEQYLQRQITKIAGEALGKHRVVYVQGNRAYQSDSGDQSSHNWIGITLAAAVEGEEVQIQVFGELSSAEFSWSPGALFRGENGQLIQRPDATLPIAQVAFVLSSSSVLVSMREPRYARQSGFLDRTKSRLDWSDASRTLSIRAVGDWFDCVLDGRRYPFTVLNCVLPAVTGQYNVYIHRTQKVLLASDQYDRAAYLQHALVATVYHNAEQGLAPMVLDERHGCAMSGNTHYALHNSVGAIYRYGLALLEMVVDGDGSSDDHVYAGVEDGEFLDEDLVATVQERTTGEFYPKIEAPMLWREGADWRYGYADYIHLMYPTRMEWTGAVSAYNREATPGVWDLEEIPDGAYVLVHYLASADFRHPIFTVLGGSYSSLANIRKLAAQEILAWTGLPLEEVIVIGTRVFRSDSTYTNTAFAAAVSVDGESWIDWREKEALAVTANASDAEGIEVEASEILAPGAMAQIWDDGGTPKVRNADATAEGKECSWFTLLGAASGAVARLYASGRNTALSGLTPGAIYYLSTTPGEITDDVSGYTIGNVVQPVGVAESDGVLAFAASASDSLILTLG